MRLWGLLFCFLSHAQAQDFTSTLDLQGVLADFNQNGACVSAGAARICRSLPWAPRLHEGVVEKSSAVFIFLDADLPRGTQIERWSKKFVATSRAEMVSYFLVNNPGLGNALINSPYTVAYLVMMKKVEEVYRIASIGMYVTGQIQSEIQSQYDLVQSEIEETRTEWIPPLKFKMGHQFKLNDTI